jgi:hypothetical protein
MTPQDRRWLGREPLLTTLTLMITAVWLVTFFRPVDNSPAIDTAMLLILGFWFSNKALQPNVTNGNGDV